MVKLIGLVGRARVGKDTVASFFSDEYKPVKLARPVKDACKALYDWTEDHVETDIKEVDDPRWGVSPRLAMIHLTQSIRTFMSADFFTQRFFRSWDGSPVIITDVRFPQDVNEIHSRGGITIKITRDSVHKHDIEFGIDSLSTTYEIENNGTLDALRVKVAAVRAGL
jgi:hypothetical protein